MKKFNPEILVTIGALLSLAGLAHADNAVYACVNANGVESLTNVPNSGNCKQLFSYTPPPPAANEVTAPPAPASATPTHADSAPVAASVAIAPVAADRAARKPALVNGQPPLRQPRTPGEQRLAQRRDTVIEQTRLAYGSDQPPPGMNRAVNRRYLMTNRAAYQKAIGVMQD
jgi:hypothetical protein